LRASAENAKDKARQRALTGGINQEFTQITRRALASRGLEDISRTYTNPDNNLICPSYGARQDGEGNWSHRDGIARARYPEAERTSKAARDAIFKG